MVTVESLLDILFDIEILANSKNEELTTHVLENHDLIVFILSIEGNYDKFAKQQSCKCTSNFYNLN